MLADGVVTDLDGTFWGTDTTVHPATLAGVARLDADDLPLLIATGRRARSALVGLQAVGLDDRPGILMNGALARHDLRGESFLVEPIDTSDALHVWEAFDNVGLEPIVYIDHPETDMLVGARPAAGNAYLQSAPGVRWTDELRNELIEHPVIGFGAFGYPEAQLRLVAEEINGFGSATAILAKSLLEGDHGLMIQGAGVDKQTGIEAWCDSQGIDPSRIAAVGDGENDRLMLEAAAIAIVPTNAPEEIRALADVEIAPNEEGGWFDVPGIVGL